MVCVDVSLSAAVEKYPDFRETGIPVAILPDISSVLASISEILNKSSNSCPIISLSFQYMRYMYEMMNINFISQVRIIKVFITFQSSFNYFVSNSFERKRKKKLYKDCIYVSREIAPQYTQYISTFRTRYQLLRVS